MKLVHGVTKLKRLSSVVQNVNCDICNKPFYDKSTLLKHKKNIHKSTRNSTSTNNNGIQLNKCLDCGQKFSKRKDLIKHLVDIHNFKEEIIEEEFITQEDFHLWLKTLEEENKVEYIRKTGKHVTKDYTIYYYECNRSGNIPTTSIRKRVQKSQGSQKIGLLCSSHIVVKLNNLTKTVHVKYQRTHYGHDIQLQHIRIPQSAKRNIAGKLLLGVPASKIIDSIRDSTTDNLQRVDLTTKKDIYNIKKSFKIDVVDGVRHSDDATSVSLWIKECSASGDNPVLLYKPQGTDEIQYNLKSSDFCLILMNGIQKQCLQKFAYKFISIDGTHGTNPYDFELTTLMVSDEFGEGVPIAYMISNRKDTDICKVLFTTLKKAAGLVETRTFMSDITETYYSAWVNVMATVPNRLFCSWHIDRAWKQNLMKIVCDNRDNSIEKRKEVYKALKMVQTALDMDTFKACYDEFLIQLQLDTTTKSFYDYFVCNYGNNQSSWAYCYRKELLINTNMYLESMHRIIKYEYLEGRKVKRLDKSLHNLMRFTRDKQIERIIKLTKGKNTERQNTINSSHRSALNSHFELEHIDDCDTRKWSILNKLNKHSYIIIEKSNISCCALQCHHCNVCYHCYSCNCMDYYIKSNICKHIHFVCMQDVERTIISPSQTEELPTENLDGLLKGLKKEPKENSNLQNKLVDAALELVSLASKPASNEIISTAIKQVNATASLLKLGESSKTQCLEISRAIKLEPSNKKISKQVSFFSTKKRKTISSNRLNHHEFPKPSDEENSILQQVFFKKISNISTSPDADHNYASVNKK